MSEVSARSRRDIDLRYKKQEFLFTPMNFRKFVKYERIFRRQTYYIIVYEMEYILKLREAAE